MTQTDYTAKARELCLSRAHDLGRECQHCGHIAAALREAVEAEREACAKWIWKTVSVPCDGSHAIVEKCMEAIRSRGEVAK